MEVNVYFNGPATEIDMGPREFSVMPATGPQGPQGETGPQGNPGPGLAAGGTTGQVAVKKSSTDYDTEWKTLAGILPYALTCADSNGELIVTITSQT